MCWKTKAYKSKEKKTLKHVDCCPIALLSSVPYACEMSHKIYIIVHQIKR